MASCGKAHPNKVWHTGYCHDHGPIREASNLGWALVYQQA